MVEFRRREVGDVREEMKGDIRKLSM